MNAVNENAAYMQHAEQVTAALQTVVERFIVTSVEKFADKHFDSHLPSDIVEFAARSATWTVIERTAEAYELFPHFLIVAIQATIAAAYKHTSYVKYEAAKEFATAQMKEFIHTVQIAAFEKSCEGFTDVVKETEQLFFADKETTA